jgi:hypothetical protein
MAINYKGQDTEKAGQSTDTLYQTASLVSSSLIFTTLGGVTSSINLSSLSGSFSGSIAGTASYSLTSSYSTTLGASLANNSSGQLTLRNSNASTISTISKLTASLALTASQADSSSYAISSSYSETASFAINGLPAGTPGQILQINNSGSYQLQTQINSTNGSASIDFDGRVLYYRGGVATAIEYDRYGYLYDVDGALSVDFGNRQLIDSSTVLSIDHGNRVLSDTLGLTSVDYANRTLYYPDGSSPAITYGVQNVINITGSLSVSGSINSVSIDNLAWISYTPTWTTDGTQPTIGNGTLTGAYKQIGKTVFVRVRLVFGSTTNGGTGAFYFNLPVTASSAAGIQFPCSILDDGNAWYQATVNGQYGGFTYKTALIGQSGGGANSSQGISSTFPIGWGNLDSLQFNGSYEAA